MVSLAHSSPQPKWHLDQFSHFCIAHGRVSSGMPQDVLSIKIAPSHGDLDPHLIVVAWADRVYNPNGISVGSTILHSTSECHRSCWGMHFPLKIAPFHGASGPHLVHGSLDPPDSASQMAPWSVQLFLHSSPQSVPILYNGPPSPPHISCSHLIHGSLGQPQSSTHTTSQSVFAGLTTVTDCLTDRPTDHTTQSVTTGHNYPHRGLIIHA